MKRTIAAVAFAAAVFAPAQFATAATASAVVAPIDGPMLGSSDVGCGAQGCTSPLVEFILITLPELLSGSGS